MEKKHSVNSDEFGPPANRTKECVRAGTQRASSRCCGLASARSLMPDLTTDTVASLLRDGATRTATLEALEQQEGAPIDPAVALAAAPALMEALAMDATEVGRDDFDRIGLLLARLAAEASDDPSAVYGGALCEGRFAAYYRSKGSVLAQAVGKAASELTWADARSFACAVAYMPPSSVRGITGPVAAAGFATTLEYLALYMTEDWFCK